MGTPEFALPCLETLAGSKHKPVGVVSAPPKPAGRGLEVKSSPVELRARELGFDVQTPEKLKDPGFLAWLRGLNPDVAAVVAFRYLPREVFALPRNGSVNLHASLLPKYRGAAPINWAIYNGERKTGVTTFLLDDRVDTGAILAQRERSIGPEETAGELAEKLARLGAELLLETLDGLEAGTLMPVPQSETGASSAPKLKKEDGFIRWERPALQVHNKIRAFSPAPGAFGKLGGEVVKIYRSRVLPSNTQNTASGPGSWLHFDDRAGLAVCCGEGAIELLELSLEGRKKLTGPEFARGQKRLADKTFELKI
ncbi:MAG: methionyl-tRNA formyltransferase [candidate division Zixibacteria bacterium]|nr:methionyl-tRNA formyltransferase [candidate division Zixibacteria bacterium]